jgi:hypothetical protein
MSPFDRTPLRVAAFAVALAVVFAVALGLGSRVGPLDAPAAADAGHGHGAEDNHDVRSGSHDAEVPGGVMVSQDGYTLHLAQSQRPAGRDRTVAFAIEGPDGRPVTSYTQEHEKDLHLIAVRRDFSWFQHVHPVLRADGTWTTNLDLTPGAWRLFADFTPAGGAGLTLGAGRYHLYLDFRHDGVVRTAPFTLEAT